MGGAALDVVAWVAAPHLLVAQAVTAALTSVGAPVEVHAWETLVEDTRTGDRPPGGRHVVAVINDLETPEVVDHVALLLSVEGVRVVVVTSARAAIWWGGLLDGNALDVVTMVTSVHRLAELVRRFIAGEMLMEPDRRVSLREAWLRATEGQQRVVGLVATLSPQQLRVLELLASGRRVREVAEIIGVAEGTVRSHVKALRHKLGAATQLEAVAMLRQVDEVGAAADLVPRPRTEATGAGQVAARR